MFSLVAVQLLIFLSPNTTFQPLVSKIRLLFLYNALLHNPIFQECFYQNELLTAWFWDSYFSVFLFVDSLLSPHFLITTNSLYFLITKKSSAFLIFCKNIPPRTQVTENSTSSKLSWLNSLSSKLSSVKKHSCPSGLQLNHSRLNRLQLNV